MNRVQVIVTTVAVILSLVLGACGPQLASAPTATPAAVTAAPSLKVTGAMTWQDDWERTLAAARKEGSVSIYMPSVGDWRPAVTEVMSKQYGLNVDIVVAKESQLVERLVNEQRNRINYADVYMGGAAQFISALRPAGVFDSLEKVFVLPEVTDPKAWWRGQLTFLDPDTKTYFVPREYVTAPLAINTELVKPEEMKSWNDLLNPKWKGKIIILDPTISGGGQDLMSMLAYKVMNWDFVLRLAQQEPTILQDTRQMAEWVARGKNPLVIGPSKAEVFSFMQAGAPIDFYTPSEGTYVTPGGGYIALLKTRPNPNAARVFINYFCSKEGQTLYSKLTGYQSARVDVPTDFLPATLVRQPGVKYPSTLDREFLQQQPDLIARVTALYKPLVK